MLKPYIPPVAKLPTLFDWYVYGDVKEIPAPTSFLAWAWKPIVYILLHALLSLEGYAAAALCFQYETMNLIWIGMVLLGNIKCGYYFYRQSWDKDYKVGNKIVEGLRDSALAWCVLIPSYLHCSGYWNVASFSFIRLFFTAASVILLSYRLVLACNPFGAGSSSSTSCYTEKLAVYLCQIDSANEIPQGPLDIDSDADIICILVLGEGQRDSWVEKLQDTFDGTHDFNDHLYADSDDIAHCLLVFVSTELYGTLSNAQSGVANYSTGVTFWIGETTFGIYGTEGGGYEDVEIGVPSLDLIQFRHVFAIGDCITDTIPLSGSEMAKGSCGSDSCFLWRSQPDGFEGTSVKKSSGSNSLGPYAVFETAAVLPTVSQPTEGDSPYMLIIDNMRANGLPADGSPYVYVGGQFCEDRRTTAKSGTTNPVWKFDRQVGGQVQSTVEVLQVPTYVSDPKYLGAQRVMIGVLDDAELEDPLIGFAFLPLAKSLKAPDTATDFALDLFNGMEVVGSLTGRISVHSMHSESSGTAEKVIQSDGGNNRSIIQQYFRRYDLDDSGTINSSEELQQLCTNLSVRLELKFSVNDIDAKVTSAGDMTVNNWDLDQFTQWFSDEFEIQVM